MLLALTLVLALVPIAEPMNRGSSEYSWSPLVASNGSTFAVAWNGDTPHVTIFDERGNVGARVERVTEEQAFVQDIAAVGDAYVLVYVTANVLHAVTIGQGGTVDSNEAVMPGWSGAIATIGSSALMMNELGAGMLIDGTGRRPVTISETTTYSPDIAASRSTFFCVWLDAEQVWGSRLVPGSSRASPPVLISPSDPAGFSGDRPSIASDGESFVVAWKAGQEIRVANIDGSGAPPAPRTIATDATGVPSITWNGSDFLVVYPAEDGLVTVELGANRLTRLRGETRPGHPRIASSGHASLIVREEYGGCYASHGIAASYIGAADSFLVSTGVAAQVTPAAASNPARSAVAFVERGEAWRLRIALTPFDGQTIDVSSDAEVKNPAIAAGGGDFLVTWFERQDDCGLALKVAAVAPGRREVAAHTIATNVNGSPPAIGWNGREFVVVWQRGDAAQLEGARVALDGTPIDAVPMPLTVPVQAPDPYTSVSAISPSLRWSGGEWLLVWQVLQTTFIPFHSDPPPVSTVRARRIAADLRPASDERTVAAQAWFPVMDVHAPIVVWSDSRGVITARIADDGSTTETVVATVQPASARSFACSTRECALSIDALLLRLSRDGKSVLASQTFPAPIAALTWDGSSFLAVTAGNQPPQLFASEVPPLGPRRRIVR